MIRKPLVALSFALLAGECQRKAPDEFARSTPVEPAPQPESRRAVDASESTLAPLSGRCVRPTPAQAPPPVAPGPAAGCPPDPEGAPLQLGTVPVVFPEVSGVAVEAELVRSEHDSQRGLMYRRTIGEERGMLFDLRVRDDHKFWMHNTCIPLDLIYADEDGLIVGIVENAPTLNDESRGVGCPSRWVLEVNAGWARRHGVKAGQHLRQASSPADR